MNRLIAVLFVGFLTLLIVPILLAHFGAPVQRSFEWVRLEDTRFQEVSFQNREDQLELAGMLFVPGEEGQFPAAVIIHGSGTSRRDNGWYLTLAQYLQEHGIVVLLPDKRGSEKSQGDWRTASLEELATDTIAAVDFLKKQNQVGISHLGVIGLSEGGHIAPIVADQRQDIDFVVNIVGAAVPLHDVLLYEESHNLREFGILSPFANLLAYPAAWSIIYVRKRGFWDAVGNFDPLPYWQRATVDSLVLYGENDTNVPSRESADALRSLGNPNIRVKIYQGSGHALESPKGEGNSIFRRDALRDIRDFIHSASTD